MNKQDAILRISLIPLVVIIGLILGAGYLLMEGEVKLPKLSKGPQITRLEGFPTVVYTSDMLEKQRLVIKSEEELTEFLNYIDPSGLLEVNEKIDFEKEYLLGVSTQTEDETEHQLRVRKVYENKRDKQMLVSIRETEAGGTCDVEMDSNVSVDLVSVSKTELDVEFERIKQVLECD